MSGPRVYDYRVEQEALRQRAEQRRLESNRTRLLGEASALERECREALERFGADVAGGPLKMGDPGASDLQQSRFEEALREATRALHERVRVEQQRQMLAPLEALGREAAAHKSDTDDARVLSAETADAIAVSREAARILAAIPARITAREREELVQAISKVSVDPGQAGAEMQLVDLRARVAAVQQAASERAVRDREVATAVTRLSALGTPSALQSLKLVEAERGGLGPLPPEVTRSVEQAEQRAAEESERGYVAEVLQAALSDLGCEVGPGFTNALLARGYADVGVAAWPEYGVRVRADGAGGHLGFNVVRGEGKADPGRDADAETAWCAVLPALLDDLERVGVHAELTDGVAAGVYPVQVDPEFSRADEHARHSPRGVPQARQAP